MRGGVGALVMVVTFACGSGPAPPETPAPKPAAEAAETDGYRTVTRPPFSIELPDWELTADEGSAAVGQLRVQRGPDDPVIQILWFNRELKSETPNVFASAPQMERTEATVGGDRHLSFRGALSDKVSVAGTIVTCEKTGVEVSVMVFSESLSDAEGVWSRAIESLRCRGDGPEAFAPVVRASSDLGPEFGYQQDGTGILLMDKSDHIVTIVPTIPEAFELVKDRTAQFLASVSKESGTTMELVAGPKPVVTLGGTPMRVLWTRDDPDETSDEQADPLIWVIGVIACGDDQGLNVIAISADGQATYPELEALVTRVGCPGAGPAVQDRSTGCELGLEALCPGAASGEPTP